MNITKSRLEEIASWLASGLIEDNRDEALEFMVETIGMSKEEIEYLSGVDLTQDECEEYMLLNKED